MYPELVTKKTSQIQNTYSLHYWTCMSRLILAFPSETQLDPEPIQDLQVAMDIGNGRKWKVMSLLYPANIRPYLCFFAAFSRMYDDLIDDASTKEEAQRYLLMMRRFVSDAFVPSEDRQPLDIDWDYYRQELPSENNVAVFRNIARMGHFLCPKTMSRLVDSLEMDVLNEPKKTKEDLTYFCYRATGNFLELCTSILMYKMGNGNWAIEDTPSRNEQALRKYGKIGEVI
jgi:phytoene/squalene synthetase